MEENKDKFGRSVFIPMEEYEELIKLRDSTKEREGLKREIVREALSLIRQRLKQLPGTGLLEPPTIIEKNYRGLAIFGGFLAAGGLAVVLALLHCPWYSYIPSAITGLGCIVGLENS